MKITFKGSEYYVEGSYTPGREPRYYGDNIHDGEPSTFDIGAVILLDCDEDGNEMNFDATDEVAMDQEFIDLCIEYYEQHYKD